MNAVTLTDVAVRAGVSQPTASRVLNGSKRRPGAAVVEAVRKAAEELGYTPNAQAQALARSSTGLLGLVLHDIADPYFSSIAGGVQSAAQRRGLQVLLATTQREPEQELAAVAAFISHRTDAMVVVGTRANSSPAKRILAQMSTDLARYTANGGKVVAIGQRLPHAHVLAPQNRSGAEDLADALVGQGHRNFAILIGPSHLQTAIDRCKGFTTALARHGLQPEVLVPGPFTRDGGYEAAGEFLRMTESSRGINRSMCLFAMNDVMALGAMAALRDQGITVPKDVQVAGFDDIPTLRDHSPGLTTVRLPLHAMGERAVELLFSGADLTVETVPGEVVLRESTELN